MVTFVTEVKMKNQLLRREDANRCMIQNAQGIPITLFANADVPVESAALEELRGVLELHDTAQNLFRASREVFSGSPALERVAVTPDFHKGSGIPIGTVLQTKGFVVPQAIGSDINCGMRLHRTSLSAEQITANLDELEARLRHIFFEAGRNIPMTRAQREALLTNGLPGLVDSVPKCQSEGLWRFWHDLDWARDLEHIDQHGGLHADLSPVFNDWLGTPGLSRDAQIGSIGGGNHFVEIQRIERIHDRGIAHAWGLREGMVTVMIHTGSLSIGAQSAALIRHVLQQAYPRTLPKPQNGLFVLPIGDSSLEPIFWNALGNAANFAFANRAMLALMTWQALESITETEYSLLYDAPHNLVWRDGDTWIHRKGATPARGLEAMQNTPFAYLGEPVLVPGSMGSSSFIMAGLGNPEALSSASHGAGRALSRGQASRGFARLASRQGGHQSAETRGVKARSTTCVQRYFARGANA
jgi:tRNA-splicing ligase RtcB (3'-phosphate/5'-hydroxy nucleic acid ligase)